MNGGDWETPCRERAKKTLPVKRGRSSLRCVSPQPTTKRPRRLLLVGMFTISNGNGGSGLPKKGDQRTRVQRLLLSAARSTRGKEGTNWNGPTIPLEP